MAYPMEPSNDRPQRVRAVAIVVVDVDAPDLAHVATRIEGGLMRGLHQRRWAEGTYAIQRCDVIEVLGFEPEAIAI